MHPSNPHTSYNFPALTNSNPSLLPFVFINEHGTKTIDFSDPEAVIELNKALLKHHYNIAYWNIPEGFLCPPVPGRADYIHYLADLLSESNNGILPPGKKIRVLDTGVGANAIYPLLGNAIYHWKFTGSDINQMAIQNANELIRKNHLEDSINIKLQPNPDHIFKDIIKPDDQYDLTLCNPPFHSSSEEAKEGTIRKWKNLKRGDQKANLNFGGQHAELWYHGGEQAFIYKMIRESKEFSKNVFWFTTLVSKKETLPSVYGALKKVEANDVRTINMSLGNKISRIVAWTFLSADQLGSWKKKWN